ncbi:putative RNA-directed DNA polymerase from mobile element jockey-like 92 [Homarus americanus]|uniref:Putative RNA-directed DNA polymerase from mobile element jockey-like 92 n=1 Tax=Homarus americanus TaxID=6706 RepID=A0A8J5N8K7_HOMAM|nr:putative RNA-directed DNA polymerase from mobile element jockey-like 92 [Homarus americanus]
MDLGILNTGDITHYHIQTNTTTAVDLSLGSADSLLDFEWRVTDDFRRCDHYPILLSSLEVLPTPQIPRWRLDKADWDLFKELTKVVKCTEEFPFVDEVVEYSGIRLGCAGHCSNPRTSGFVAR